MILMRVTDAPCGVIHQPKRRADHGTSQLSRVTLTTLPMNNASQNGIPWPTSRQFGTVRLILETWTTGYSIPSPALERLRGAEMGRRSRNQESFKTRRSDPQAGFRSSTALDPELFRGTALLACERESLEFPAEQNWFDTDNDHFYSAVRTCRRSSYFEWRFWNSHVISFRRS